MRSFALSGAVLIAAIAKFSSAAAINTTETTESRLTGGSQWARFCNDDACSDSCGEWVSMGNSGCLNESGRGSFQVKGNDYAYTVLIQSAAASCPCQTSCMDGEDSSGSSGRFSSGCHKIDGTYESFRFVTEETCPSDNC